MYVQMASLTTMVTGLCSVVNELKKDLLVRSKHQDALILQCDAAVNP